MNNILEVKMPIDYIANTVNLLNKQKIDAERIQEKIDNLGSETDAQVRGGLNGVKEWKNEMEILEIRRKNLAADSCKIVDANKKRAFDELDELFLPNGNDLIGENAADVAVINAGLIMTPEQLELMLKRHNNAAFRTLASNYAKTKQWSGFEYIDKANSVREYFKVVFDGLMSSAENLLGYSSIQFLETSGEYERMAEASGLLTDFLNSDGRKIDREIRPGNYETKAYGYYHPPVINTEAAETTEAATTNARMSTTATPKTTTSTTAKPTATTTSTATTTASSAPTSTSGATTSASK